MRASDRAYSALRTEILEWHLAPGTVLAEVEQAARLGVSRTPLREALARLSADGLVESLPGRGVVDWPAFMKALAEIGYTGPFNFECTPPGETPAQRLRALEQAYDWMAQSVTGDGVAPVSEKKATPRYWKRTRV